ncbi:MAG: YggS family pyridoxal phosphate-dependent enzyme [Acidobacteria bacterium]|nr:YggS family pyridoxal phosphate-dependent enzyme [Acidobacteriota bacterium]
MSPAGEIGRRLTEVRRRLAAAADRAGRRPDDIRLIAVSKTFGLDSIRAAVDAGQVDFGENRVQEALQKMWGSSDLQIRWHLVGHLQTNKAKKATGFAWIHSVDSLKLLEGLDRAALDAEGHPDILVQVDLAGEATKFGAPPQHAVDLVHAAARCRGVRLAGLMILPPFADNPEDARPYFRRLRELRDDLVARGLDRSFLKELSMGMSHDFEVAIQEGATMVRVGTAIFGERPTR